jgi:hypothetical protein
LHVIQRENLPRIGSSYNFVGADQGDVPVSMFLVEAVPGRGAPLHCHRYDEIVVVQEGSPDSWSTAKCEKRSRAIFWW